MSELAVKCKGIRKAFGQGRGRVEALRGIDLDVNVGELMMLVGPSGSGKTTLISVIAGTLERDEGECTVLGHDFQALSERKRSRFRGENIGFVFQSFHLIPTLPIAENVAIPLLIKGENRGGALKKACALLDEVGLGDRHSATPRELSGGEQQRVAIARALVHGPRLIVCDEPTSALDHVAGGHILELLREVVGREGRSLIVVTHDQRIFGYADRIAEMEDGRIVAMHASPEEMQ